MGRIDAYPEPSSSLVNLTISGNTTGTSVLVDSGTLTLAGGNRITLSQSGNAITISGDNQTVQTQNMVDLTLAGNTSGALALISSGTLTLAGGNQITLSQAGNAVTISGPAEVTRSLLFEGFAQSWESVSAINGSLRLQPLQVRGAITATEFNWLMNNTLGASAATVSAWAGVYDVVNSTSLALLSSGSASYGIATVSTGSYSGFQRWSMPFNMNASRGDYAMGLIVRTSGGGSFNIFGASVQNFLGAPNVATNATITLVPFLGVYSSSTTAMPANVQAASIMGNTSRARRYDFMFRAM